MNKLINKLGYFSKCELILWGVSALSIIVSFIIFDKTNYITLTASLIGTTSLILCAKGNPLGQILMILFSILYGIISLSFSYYGEMITYLGMTMPMAIFSLISWLRNPYKGNKSEVAVNKLNRKEIIFMLILSAVVTLIFFHILKYFNTANLLPSTISITTSFIAAYLTLRRSPFFALIYALNDIVLIFLWTMASISNSSYISVIVCFIAFFVNDIYGFISWLKMQKRQAS
ncbi:MAG: nicotinamide riboside transporter PnuC [Ruminococcus sp.]|nr:nicotinamide riboside transporter PnuC [Ruminococcus sp.]